MSDGVPRPKRGPGRRRRRLYWTLGTLLGLAVLGSALGVSIYRARRPDTYRPGEQLAEITRKLDLGIPEEAPAPVFVDVTAEAGLGGFVSFRGARTSQLPEDMGAGAAWGDYDDDGDDDLFLVGQGGPLGTAEGDRAPSLLYENRGDGTFAEVGSFPETRILGMGAAWADYDGDGRLDLVVTGYDALRLYHNDGDGFRLDDAIAERDGYWAGASWADFDADGDLDLYVCGYVQYVPDARGAERPTQQYGRAVPYTLNPASFDPQRNLLFRNDGRGGFEEVAERFGADNPAGRSLGALWHDIDEDGRIDLYVANDISDNALLLNKGDRFEDVSHAAFVADYRGAMGLAAGDWNRDGDDDLFITHWIAQENALYDSLLRDLEGRPEAAAGLRFMDVADQRGLGQVALQSVGWGTEFADLDSDGWLDLVVANGSTFETDETPRGLRAQPSFLFWNRQGQAFHDLAPLNPLLSTPHVSRGMALSDYDNDGDLDVLFVDRDAGVRLLRNDMPQGNRVQLRLLPRQGSPVEGTRLEAAVAGARLRRSVNSVSYLSQSTRTVHLGLGEAVRLQALQVRWPGGLLQTFTDLEVNALWELTEDVPAPRKVAPLPSPDRGAGAGAPLDAPSGESVAATDPTTKRKRLAEFWRRQRAAMNAMKVDRDLERAIGLFREALELDPRHEDSIYYLGNCLAETGDPDGALQRFAELMRLNHQSHRAHKRWGTLRAVTARSAADLDAAVAVLERAAAINPEETGVSLVLGEVALLQGDLAAAKQRFEWVVRSNPQSGEAFFMLGYVAWRSGDASTAVQRLEQARDSRQEEWKPSGSIAEGEVKTLMHSDETPLLHVFAAWDGTPDPGMAFAALHAHLEKKGSPA
jgi:Tfp pilus assembly protein PilF